MLHVFIHISLVGEISEVPQGTHKMEQKVMLSLFINSNTTHSNQPRKKLYLFKTFYRTIFVTVYRNEKTVCRIQVSNSPTEILANLVV